MKLKYEAILVEINVCPGKRYREYRKVSKMKNALNRSIRKADLIAAKEKRDAERPPELAGDFFEEIEMSVRVRGFLDGDGLIF